MRTVELQEFAEGKQFIGQKPKVTDFDLVIDEDCELLQGGEVVGLYQKMPPEIIGKMLAVAQSTKPLNTHRSSGIRQCSSVFGVVPRLPVRGQFCRFSSHTKNEPENFCKVKAFNEAMFAYYSKHFATDSAQAMAWRNQVEASWHWSYSPWLTTNVNMNYAIPYHTDTANLNTTLSNVFIIKKDMLGGELVLPAHRIAFAQNNGFALFFHGSKVVHGVMPIKKLSTNAFRASIVCYSLGGLKACLSPDKELEHAKNQLTKSISEKVERRAKLKLIAKQRVKSP